MHQHAYTPHNGGSPPHRERKREKSSVSSFGEAALLLFRFCHLLPNWRLTQSTAGRYDDVLLTQWLFGLENTQIQVLDFVRKVNMLNEYLYVPFRYRGRLCC